MSEFKFHFVDAAGQNSEVSLGVEAYAYAAENKKSLSQYINTQYPTTPELRAKGHTTFKQFCQSAGVYTKTDRSLGIQPPTMQEVLGGGMGMQVGIFRPDGSDRGSTSGRFLYPEILLQMVESELRSSEDLFLNGLDGLVASDISVNQALVAQPIINVKRAEVDGSGAIVQLGEPDSMISITLSSKNYNIATKAVALTIADQALQSTTLDIVGITMSAEARGRRIATAYAALAAMISGDADLGEDAVAESTKANVFDTSINANGALTHKAWVKWLWSGHKKRSITHILCDIDAALVIENRTSKPTTYSDDPQSPRIDARMDASLIRIASPILIPVDTAVTGANTIVGLDKNFGIQRITNVSASYEAIQQYVMRRATSFRVDYGWAMRKLMNDAWSILTLTT